MKICGAVLAILYIGLMLFGVYKVSLKSVSFVYITIGCWMVLPHNAKAKWMLCSFVSSAQIIVSK